MKKIRAILPPAFAGALLTLFLAGAGASAAATSPRIVLVGDSTVAPNGGWGPAFCQFLGDGVTCTNLARAGRSSKSYLAEGTWEKAIAARGDYYLIQFGHNDQPGKGPDRETDPATTYTANLARYVDEARAIGATPVLITSLTRRKFSTNDLARLDDSLSPYVEAMKKLAAEKNVPLIDLHARSIALCEKLGPAGTAQFNRTGKDGLPDTTHLSDAGGMAFARLVVEDLRRVVPALAPVLLAEPRAAAAPEFGLIGYGNVGFPVTGGGGGETVTVTNGAQLNEYASTKKPCIIQVSGTLEVNGMDTHVGPNKTIIGVGTNATLHGGGLYLYKSTNVIIRNLTIKGSTDDNLGILYSSNVWVDHCTFMDSKDGNMDINRASDNITISWCKFLYETEQPHALASLIGSSDSEVISSNKLHLTFHHNWFGQNVKERMPSIRWGTVHLFNNYYNAPGNNYCIRTRLFAQSRIENNVFENVKNPWEVYITDTTNAVGRIFATNNLELNTLWGQSTTNTRKGLSIVQIVPGTDEVFTLPYAYQPDPTSSVANLVTNYAGAGQGPFAPN